MLTEWNSIAFVFRSGIMLTEWNSMLTIGLLPLATRVQITLPNLINILLMQELVRGYHKGGGRPRCALMLDLKKGYDSVHLAFPFEITKVMDFPKQYIQGVKQSVTPPDTRGVINCEMHRYFPGKRG